MVYVIIFMGVWHLLMNLASLRADFKDTSSTERMEANMNEVGKDLYEKVAKFWLFLVCVLFSGVWYFGSYLFLVDVYPVLAVVALIYSAYTLVSNVVAYKDLGHYESAIVIYKNLVYDKRYKTSKYYRSVASKVLTTLTDLLLMWALFQII